MKTAMLILALMVSAASYAADSLKVSVCEPERNDIYNALDLLGVSIYRFDLTAFLQDRYDVSLYVDEFVDGKKIGREINFYIGENITRMDRYGKEAKIKSLSIYLHEKDDTTSMVAVDIPGAGSFSIPVKLKPAGPDSLYLYHSRPFSFKPVPPGSASSDIPLLLYGSSWYDEEHNLVRFCGEDVIDPEMQAEILGYIPHYYIIYLRMSLRKNDE